MKSLLPLAIGLVLFASCNQSDSNNTEKEESEQTSSEANVIDTGNETNEEATDERRISFDLPEDAVLLEGLYATNSAIPFSQYTLSNLLDEDDATFWRTPVGAGPDEGIMFYFEEPTQLHHIEVKFSNVESAAKCKFFEVFCDGTPQWKGNSINRKVKSLYIRFNSFEESKFEKLEEGKNRVVFPKENFVAVSSVRFYSTKTDELNVVAPVAVPGQVKASSTLKPTVTYHPANLFDSYKELAYVEAADGLGKDVTLTFDFDREVTIDGLKFWNGYQRSLKHLSANAKLRSFEFGPTGEAAKSYEIPDMEVSRVGVEAITGKSFTLTIKDAYPGTTYEDLAISELRFYNGDTPFLLDSKDKETFAASTLKKASGPLKDLLNSNLTVRSIKTENTETSSFSQSSEYSINLRSNNTFVIYETESEYGESFDGEGDGDYYDDQSQFISEGSWEIVSQNNEKARIKIFGRRYSPTSGAELYKGKVTSDNLKIFKDFVDINSNQIKGQSFIPTITF